MSAIVCVVVSVCGCVGVWVCGVCGGVGVGVCVCCGSVCECLLVFVCFVFA